MSEDINHFLLCKHIWSILMILGLSSKSSGNFINETLHVFHYMLQRLANVNLFTYEFDCEDGGAKITMLCFQ